VVWRPAAPVAPGKRRHAFPLEREGIASQKKHYYPLESRNTKLAQMQCSNSTSKKATKEIFVSSKTQSRKKERKKESHSVEAKHKMTLFELTQTPLL